MLVLATQLLPVAETGVKVDILMESPVLSVEADTNLVIEELEGGQNRVTIRLLSREAVIDLIEELQREAQKILNLWPMDEETTL